MNDKVDTAELTRTIEHCFDLAGTGGVPAEQQQEARTQAKRLRGALLNLITARFEARTAEIVAANSQIKAVNTKLSEAIRSADKVADALKQVGDLVGVLDKLLSLATTFL